MVSTCTTPDPQQTAAAKAEMDRLAALLSDERFWQGMAVGALSGLTDMADAPLASLAKQQIFGERTSEEFWADVLGADRSTYEYQTGNTVGYWGVQVVVIAATLPLGGTGAASAASRGGSAAARSAPALAKAARAPKAVAPPVAATAPRSSKAAADAAEEATSIIYLRTSKIGKSKPYVGQAKDEARYNARQREHDRAHPDDEFDYEILETVKPKNRDVAEEWHIRDRGGPATKKEPNGKLSNKRLQMNDKRYKKAGGDRWREKDGG